MSEMNPHDAAQTLPQDRETLYHLVWCEPAECIAVLYDISTELLAKRCSEMRIPRPLAGYCKALAKGTAPAIPALPDLKKGKTVKVCENDNPSMHSPAVKASKSATSLALKQALLQAETAVQQRLTAAQTRAVTATGQVLVIGNSYDTRGRQQMASQTPGATTVEAVDLVDLTDFGAGFNLEAADALTRLVKFAAGVMTQVGPAALLPRLETLRRGRARNPPTVAEAALVAFAERPSFTLAAEALRLLTRQDNARVYRPEVLRCCLRALQSAAAGGCTFADATINERERNRHESRPLPRRVIGSTLLLKGLEGEVAVITSPEEMDAQHLYVAMTRGASRLVVCSLTPILAAR